MADQFSALPAAEITGLFPGNDAAAEIEEIALTKDGRCGWIHI